MEFAALANRYRIARPGSFRLRDCDPADCCGLDIAKDEAKAMLDNGIKRLSDLQERLYAQNQWAVLVILQGMDAAGKDSVIKHVMSGVNPQGCRVHSFKAPSAEELDHDFLWRAAVRLPERGCIGIFNRSYYEEMLVVRVHPGLLAHQKLPPRLAGKDIWQGRFKTAREFESTLARNGTLVLKFFLNLSPEEQRQRFLARLEEPSKRWKFSMGDVAERALWDKYMRAYEDVIRNTSRPDGRWYVVPADKKWFTRLVVAAALVEALEALDLRYPKFDASSLPELRRARRALLKEAPARKKRKAGRDSVTDRT
jgi:PPK2 family polyphosphate:nucleotide phosphotransferase